MSHEEKARNFKVLVRTLVKAFDKGLYVDPMYHHRAQFLHKRYEGQYFESDFLRKMYDLKRDKNLIDQNFRDHIEKLADKMVEKEVEALRVMSELQREMLKIETALVKAEREADLQAKLFKTLERVEKDSSRVCQKISESLANLDFSGVDQDMRDFKRDVNVNQYRLREQFRMSSVSPDLQGFETYRQHMSRVREIIKSFVYEP